MGSTNFEHTVMSTNDPRALYRELCAEAQAEYGYDPYNGKINATDTFNPLEGRKPMTVEQARRIADDRLSHLRKRECEALPLVEEVEPVYKDTGTRTLTVTVSGRVCNDSSALKAAIANAAGLKVDQISSYGIDYRGTSGKPVQMTTTAKATAPAGATVKKFFIIDPSRPTMPSFEDGYSSQAEARAALSSLRFHGAVMDHPMEIIAITRRENGEPLVKATISTKTVTARFVVRTHEMVTPGKTGTTHAGWYFYGWAAC